MVHKLADHRLPTKYEQEAQRGPVEVDKLKTKSLKTTLLIIFSRDDTKGNLEIRKQKERKEKGETFN